MRDLGAHVDGQFTLPDDVEVLAETLPAPRDALRQGSARDVLDTLHERDQPFLLAGAHGREADATVARNDRRHAVVARRLQHAVPADLAVVVGVDVHESGSDDLAAGVDRLGRITGQHRVVRTAAVNFDDLAVLDRDIGGEPVRPRAVDDSATGDLQIEHICSLAAAREPPSAAVL
ncbi:hypothetical protein MPHO_08330 [Mycolicibacterium phocaicum]|nr:hypothetical protein MPHO_08330 [Mycolicibacterium phocaicum]